MLVFLVVTAACTIDATPPTTTTGTTTATPPAPTATEPPATSVPTSATTTAASATCVMGDVPFAAEGNIGSFGEEAGDAATIAGFRWSAEDQCDRFVIDLATSAGSPAATLGLTSAQFRPPSGLIRITLPREVQTTSIADTVMDTELVDHAYVVRLADGGLAVDLHVDAPTGLRARAFAVGSPARVVVDLRPAGADPPIDPPRRAPGVVLLGPPAGPAEYPLRVTGYARAPNAEVVAVLAPGTPSRVELPIEPTGGLDAWGEFTTTFDGGPTGRWDLLVGDAAAEGGGGEALLVPLDLR